MPLVDVRAHIDCDVCGKPFEVVIDHAQELSPWMCMYHEIGSKPYKNGGMVDDEFLCTDCLKAFDAALSGDPNATGDVVVGPYAEEYRKWRPLYQAFLDDVEMP